MLKEFAPMNAAELFDRAIDVYKKSFWRQLAFAAIVGVLAFAGLIFLGIILAFVLTFVFAVVPVTGGNSAAFLSFIIMVLVLAPLLLLWQAASSTGHIILAKQAFYGHTVKFHLQGIARIAWRVFTVLLAQTLIILPFIIVLFGLVSLLFPVWDELIFMPWDVFPWVSVLIFVGLIAFGYLALTNVFALSLTVAIFEEKHFFSAIKQGWWLIKGEFWRILGVRAMWYLMIFAASFALQGMFILARDAMAVFSETTGFAMFGFGLLLGLFSSIASIFATFALTPLDGILQTVIYFNQRIKKDGLDIEIVLEKLQVRS
ncbi:MAG: hypothetical protein FWB91_01785 [Defluviitaleaceae bacterium]|nr:hypothetical protein [Defluviitaleaceae bacterium]